MIALSFLGVLSKRFYLMKNLLRCLVLFTVNVPLFASAGIINLGSAEQYIFATANNNQWSGNLLLGSEAHVFGSVAASNTLELGSGVIVKGNACAGVTNNWGATVTGATGSCTNLAQLAEDINAAATQAQTFADIDLSNVTNLGNVTDSLAIAGIGFQSFLISDLLLSSGETLTVTGGVDDSFVFNIFGAAQLGSGANILLQGGISAQNVVFNFIANSAAHSFEIGGANISGTFLSSGRSFILGDGATLNNSRFYSTESIVANVQDVYFPKQTAIAVQVPEPVSIILFVMALMLVATQRVNTPKDTWKHQL
jgi:hypothetical protein